MVEQWWRTHAQVSSTPIASVLLVGNTEDSGNTAKADSCTRSDVFGCLGAHVSSTSGTEQWAVMEDVHAEKHRPVHGLVQSSGMERQHEHFSQKGAVLMSF